MTRYAYQTTVNEDRSRMQIEKLLRDNKCEDIATRTSANFSAIACILNERHLRFTLATPSLEHYQRTDKGRRRPQSQIKPYREKDLRRRWRSLLLVIKSRFVEWQDGISVFDQAFLQYIVLPNGKTAAEWMVPQIEQIYLSGSMPQQLIALPAPSDDGEQP